MRNKFNKLISIYGYKELFFIVFYPIFLPFYMLKETTLTIFNILNSLLNYNWKYLTANSRLNAYNMLFYYIQDYNIQRFGRYGKSNLLGNGYFSLKNWFHTTPFSLRLQASFGTTFIMFFAMCFWFFSWIVLYQDSSNLWILTIVLFSTLFFATFLDIQNYNILGWMLYPILLFYIDSNSYIILSLVLFLIALSSFTAFFISGFLIFISSIYLENYYLFLTLLFGGIKWIIPILISLKEGALFKISGIIGSHNKVKYSMKDFKKIDIQKIYTLGLLSQFVFISYFFKSSLSLGLILLIFIVMLFIINEIFLRFADQQSFYFTYLTISIYYLFSIDISMQIIISYIFSIFPIYGFIMNASPRGKRFISPGERNPYNIKRDFLKVDSLFKKVLNEDRVFIAFRNPKGNYSNIFEGYSQFNELLKYSATINNILLFPDMYFVYENNKEDSDESFWIDNEEEAILYLKLHNIKYMITLNDIEISSNSFNKLDEINFDIDDKYYKYKNVSIKLFEINRKI